MSQANVQSLLKKLKTAVEQPRLHLYYFFELLKNEIDIQCQKTLDESNERRILQQQVVLIDKVKQFEDYCMSELAEAVNEENARNFQVTIEQVEKDLNKKDFTEVELDRVNELLLDKLVQTEKVLFRSKSILFIKAGEIDGKEDDGEHEEYQYRPQKTV